MSNSVSINDADTLPPPPAPKRGFAAMPPEFVQECARKGGAASATCGRGHRFTSEEASAAGRKGGHAAHAKRRGGGR